MRVRSDTAIYTAFDDFEGFDSAEPERNLMRAILRGVLDDSRRTGEAYRDARQYLLSEDESYLYSFLSICHHLNLCSRTIRRVCGVVTRKERGRMVEQQSENIAA